MLKPLPQAGQTIEVQWKDGMPCAITVEVIAQDEVMVSVGVAFQIAPLLLDTKTGKYYIREIDFQPHFTITED